MEHSEDNAGIRESLLSAMADVGVLQKDSRNDHHDYQYLSEAAVKRAVHAAQVAHAVMPEQILVDVLSSEWVAGKGRERHFVSVQVTLCFGKFHRYQGVGAAMDYDDKALLKAQTAAIREAWKNVFTIATGQDPEADNSASVHNKAPADTPCLPKMKWLDDDGGKPITDVSDSVLRRYADWQRPKIKDDKFKATNLALLDAIEKLLKERDDQPAPPYKFPRGDYAGKLVTSPSVPVTYLSKLAGSVEGKDPALFAALTAELARREQIAEEAARNGDPVTAALSGVHGVDPEDVSAGDPAGLAGGE